MQSLEALYSSGLRWHYIICPFLPHLESRLQFKHGDSWLDGRSRLNRMQLSATDKRLLFFEKGPVWSRLWSVWGGVGKGGKYQSGCVCFMKRVAFVKGVTQFSLTLRSRSDSFKANVSKYNVVLSEGGADVTMERNVTWFRLIISSSPSTRTDQDI